MEVLDSAEIRIRWRLAMIGRNARRNDSNRLPGAEYCFSNIERASGPSGRTCNLVCRKDFMAANSRALF